MGFYGGEGGSGDAVGGHFEKHLEGGGRERSVSDMRGEEGSEDEELGGEGWRIRQGRVQDLKESDRAFFMLLFSRIDNPVS